MTLLWSIFSSFKSLSDSFSAIFFTGIFVHMETTSAISFSPTTKSVFFSFLASCAFLRSYFFMRASCSLCTAPAPSKSSLARSSSTSLSISRICCSSSFKAAGVPVYFSLTAEDASSIRSIALSGRFLSFMYLELRSTAACRAS